MIDAAEESVEIVEVDTGVVVDSEPRQLRRVQLLNVLPTEHKADLLSGPDWTFCMSEKACVPVLSLKALVLV